MTIYWLRQNFTDIANEGIFTFSSHTVYVKKIKPSKLIKVPGM